ncbi:type-4 uracil-DNA glycosylase [Archaeoglobus neptunius]|uniref:type-4 uracil-DNA glycosylase n=1 Tax=Archaeoglobus neptunius TaxID=2798580 RepID=UPI0019281173|nr:type-4 uracil-DNA glycosylase [Archaeoglobus neptunius]
MENLEQIAEEIRTCRRCDLYRVKTNYVPGSGSEKAEVVFVGEAPGREEDLKGEPFVGNAGKLLNEMLSKIGLTRNDVFICNVLKCRPPNNRDPAPEEVEACGRYLERQLEVIRPKIIVCLGRFAANYIFNLFGLEFTSISKVKGKVFEAEAWGGKVKIVPIYHPAAVLYRPQLKKEYEENFRVVGKLLEKKQPTLFDYL